MGAYDPENYHIASRDKKGHSSSLRVNIPTGVMQDLAELVASRRIPHLRTPADCLRDSLGRWLEWMLNENGIETFEKTSGVYKLNYKLEQSAGKRKENQALVDNVASELKEACNSTETIIALGYAHEALAELDANYREEVQGLIDRYSK